MMSSFVPSPAPVDRLAPSSYWAAGFVSAAILAYELFVMRVFAISGWSHFGSTVISFAMFGFGVVSTALCIWKSAFDRRRSTWLHTALLALGPAMVAANSLAQAVPFNPIFLVSDPNQKYYLAGYFLLYFIPFLLGALFLGLFFVEARDHFNKAYFANMTGSGLGGLVLFLGMYWLLPDRLFVLPVLLWLAGALLWLIRERKPGLLAGLAAGLAATLVTGWGFPQVLVSPFKGVSYAQKLPDTRLVCERASPFGLLQVYASSYFHFAPGLSDTATLYVDRLPENAYMGMYLDADGPAGIMRALPTDEAAYLEFLPHALPYLLKSAPEVLVMQFGGGISTHVGLHLGARHITVAEANPLVIQAIRDNPEIAGFSGNILKDTRVSHVATEGRILVAQGQPRFDIIDLSLVDSTGLSMPGGSSIHEKYTYTRETLGLCMRALKPGGILGVTIWNKEDPPKSALKLLATMVEAAHDTAADDPGKAFFVTHTYLSTLTVLYQSGGFSIEEIDRLKARCQKLSFEILYHPGQEPVSGALEDVLAAFRSNYLIPPQDDLSAEDDIDISTGGLYRITVPALIQGNGRIVEQNYLFDSKPLTNDRPYLAGYVQLHDIPAFLDKLESISDDWGYLLLWATLALSVVLAVALILLPVLFGWRAFFGGHRGKLGTVVYFFCLGIGYILVEVALISKYVLVLGNTTVSVSVLITGMLLFSGIGSYVSGRVLPRGATAAVAACSGVAVVLALYAWNLDALFAAIGMWSYGARIAVCLVLLFPLAFLMGFPFALGMGTLARLNKERFFVWAWGINGSFSVVGSVLVPVVSVLFGLSAALLGAAALYLLAIPAFLQLRLPDRSVQES
jgi:spermidine synthase